MAEGLLGSLSQDDKMLGLLGIGLGMLSNARGTDSRAAFGNALQGGMQGGLGLLEPMMKSQQMQAQREAQARRLAMDEKQFGLDERFKTAQIGELTRKTERELRMEREARDILGGIGQNGATPMDAVQRALQMGRPDLAEQIQKTIPKVSQYQQITGPDGMPQTVGMNEFGMPSANLGPAYNPNFDPRVIPQAVDKQRALMPGELELAKAKATNISVQNFPNPIPVVDPVTGRPAMVQFGNKGEIVRTPFLPEAKPPTESEATSAGYLTRMKAAEALMQQQGPAGFPTVATNLAGAIPMVGGMAQRVAETPAQGQFRQAQEDWVRAKLRKESGAVIGEQEMAREITTYFPMPGDSPQVIAQKAQARNVAMDALSIGAGRAMDRAPATPSPQQSGGLSAAEKKELDDLRKRFGK
jgi:hypothetical protein